MLTILLPHTPRSSFWSLNLVIDYFDVFISNSFEQSTYKSIFSMARETVETEGAHLFIDNFILLSYEYCINKIEIHAEII